MADSKLISVVAPVFNEEQTLPEFVARVSAALSSYTFELILVDDGSRDASWSLIQEAARKNSSIHGLRFSRNFGHQPALSAGLAQARGDAVVLIDGDLQDPPEMIPLMIEKWKSGADVVYGVRTERKGETAFKKITASLFYQLINRISHVKIPLETGDFRLLSRRSADALKSLPERVRFMRGLTSWVGFKQEEILYSRDPRFGGETKFSFFKMLKFALDGITSFTAVPLQMATYLGLFMSAAAALFAVYSLAVWIFTSAPVKGWTSLLLVVVMLGGIQLIMIGLIGEYIARIYEEVKQRPLYLISEKAGEGGTKGI